MNSIVKYQITSWCNALKLLCTLYTKSLKSLGPKIWNHIQPNIKFETLFISLQNISNVGLDLYVDAISAEISVIVWTKGPWKWCKGVGGLWFLY